MADIQPDKVKRGRWNHGKGRRDDQSTVKSRGPPNEHAPLPPMTNPLAGLDLLLDTPEAPSLHASQQAELHHTPVSHEHRNNANSSGPKFKSRPDRVKFDKSARPHDRRHRRRHHRDDDAIMEEETRSGYQQPVDARTGYVDQSPHPQDGTSQNSAWVVGYAIPRPKIHYDY